MLCAQGVEPGGRRIRAGARVAVSGWAGCEAPLSTSDRQLSAFSRGKHDEEDPIFAPLLHRYGHALLEHAIATSGALGGGGGTADKDTAARESRTVASARAKEPTTEKEAERAIGQGEQARQGSV